MYIDRNKADFDVICDKTAEFAKSDKAKKILSASEPINDYKKIFADLETVKEIMRYYENGGTLDFHEYESFEDFLPELEKKITLNALELRCLAEAVVLYAYLQESFSHSSLKSLFSAELTFLPVCRKIVRFIRNDGYIESTASAELQRIRERIKHCQNQSHSEVAAFSRDVKSKNYSNEDIISVRDGFECVAVKSNYRNVVDGLVLDSSNSGQTAFVIPSSVLKLNSEINVLTAEENNEIRRILREYSESLSEYTDVLKIVCTQLLQFDVFHAKAKFGISYHAVVPALNNSKIIRIINGKHPMIKNAVPLNVEFNRDLSVLVITGPNAGGKTVAIKTVALFQMMIQAGIPVPVSADSSFCICSNIYLDIGDEQSIEDSLSTFSGHLKRLKEITDNVKSDDLVVLDELGSGTSPIEGEALALSILEFLLKKNCIAIVTTHYQRIKQFAGITPRIKTAAMEYDEENFQPLYRLRVGARGSSHAFDIAKRMNLDEQLISRALELIDNDYINMEENIRKIEQEQRFINEEKENLKNERDKYEEDAKLLEQKIAEYKENNKELNRILRDKKRDFLSEARKEFEHLVKEIKEANASKESIKHGKEFFDTFENRNLLGEDVKYLSENDMPEKNKTANYNGTFKQGDRVIDLQTNIKGTVVSVKNKEIHVQFGAVKLICKPENLQKTEHDKNKTVYSGNVFINECKKRDIDIRGMRAQDVENELERCIDSALTANINELRILHGTGAGVLRKMVHDFLKNCPYVKKFEFEKCGDYQTNYGVTIAEL